MSSKKTGKNKVLEFLKGETVLAVSALLALLSAFLVTPDKEYLNYVDYRVLGLLFSLMVVMSGFRELGFFEKTAHAILRKVRDYRSLCLMAVALCFFSSMLITNDVALITFVPLTLLLLNMTGLREQMIPVVVLQTVAANLGSMLTPVGNPQNLYLYAVSGMSLAEFLSVMAPLTTVSFVLLTVGCLVQKNRKLDLGNMEGAGSEKLDRMSDREAENASEECKSYLGETRRSVQFVFFAMLFSISLLAVLRLIPYYIPLTIAVVGTFAVKREVLRKVDYCLLITFTCFFIFIGNMGRISVIREWLEEIIGGRELAVGFLASQVISNVPACILLSGFTENWKELLLGVNIGGLGTLIASLASLISYKFFVKEQPESKGKYFFTFTWVNVVFATVLIGMVALYEVLYGGLI